MNNIPPPPSLGADAAHAFLKPHVDKLVSALQFGWTAWERLGKEAPKLRVDLDPRARAACVSAWISAEARRLFSDQKSVRITDQRRFLELVFEDRYVVRFKKLDTRGRWSNISTKQQKLWNSQQLELPGLPPRAVRLIAGYQLNALGTALEKTMLAMPDQNAVAWVLEITGDSENVIPMPVPAAAATDKPAETQFEPKRDSIRPQKEDRDE